jgi:SPP1 family predicted phage head-tail adaptor
MADFNVTIADLRTRITLQQPTITTDAGAAQVPSWANVASNPTVWARWINAHGQEAVTSDALKSAQRATVTVRYRSDILTTWAVKKADNTLWQIISVDHVQGRNRWTELVVERVKGTV